MNYIPEYLGEQLEGFLDDDAGRTWESFTGLPTDNLAKIAASGFVDPDSSHKGVAPTTKELATFGQEFKKHFGIDLVFFGHLGEGYFTIDAMQSAKPVKNETAKLVFVQFAHSAQLDYCSAKLEAFWD